MNNEEEKKEVVIEELVDIRQRMTELNKSAIADKPAEEELMKSEERYRSLVELSPDMIALHSRGKYVYVNPAGIKLLGASGPGDLIGKSVFETIHPGCIEIVNERIRQLEQGKGVPLLEEKYIRLDGTIVDVEVAASPIFFQGEPMVQAIARDITERKQAEEVLREAEERYRLLFEISTNAVLIRDREGVIRLANPTAIKMLKASRPDEIIGKAYLDFVHPEDRPGSIDRIQRQMKALQGEPGIDPVCKMAPLREHRLLTLDGETINVESSGVAFRDQGEEWIQGIFHDITQRKQAEEALRKSEEVTRRMAHENAIVAEVGRIISSSLSIEDIYERFAEKARQLFSFDWISISIIDHEKGMLSNTYNSGDVIPGRGIMEEIALAGSLTEEVMRRRSSRIIELEDADEVASRFPKLSPFWRRGYRSFMAIPLISNDQVVGVLHINSKRSKAFNEADASLGERIAAQITGPIASVQSLSGA